MQSLAFLGNQPAIFVSLIFILGLLVGSFLNVVIHRLPLMLERDWRAQCANLLDQPAPAEETYNLVVPRSACPPCGHVIGALENIPVLSYLALRGRCSACGADLAALSAGRSADRRALRRCRLAFWARLGLRVRWS